MGYRFLKIINRLKREFKYLFQRVMRGYDDSEMWNLDSTFAKFILPRLKRFKQMAKSSPENLTMESWLSIIDEMIFAFENVPIYRVGSKDEPRIKKGLKLFAEYYNDLWF